MNRSRAWIRWLLTGPALVILGLCPKVAEGSDDPEAAIRRGIELRKKGEDEAARREFETAYAAAKSPRAAAQLGFAEQAIGDWASAEVHVMEALWRRPLDCDESRGH
jgi:hypothetical protein